jgi:N-acyl-L-homoserine lactone synthetase
MTPSDTLFKYDEPNKPLFGRNESVADAQVDFDPIPRFESEVFVEHDQAKFWLGIVATLGEVEYENEHLAARQLRARVYIDQYGFLPANFRKEDGGESDIDDIRSVHFSAVEQGELQQRLVGTSRLIAKRSEHDELPVEHYFPDVFKDNPAPVGSFEASRFIARHEDKMIQHTVSLSLMRAMSAYGKSNGEAKVYAVVEKHLAKLFRIVGLPFEELAPARALPEYDNTLNIPIMFDTVEVFEAIDSDVNNEKIISLFFQNALVDLGVGHYDNTLINQVDN